MEPEPLAFAHDMDALLREYSDFLRSLQRRSVDTALVTTLEEKRLLVHVAANGWTVDDDDRVYESAEALLMACSPAFTQHWHARLLEKLQALDATPITGGEE